MDEVVQTNGDAVPDSSVAAVAMPWGFWATIGFSLVVIVAFFVVQIAVTVGYLAVYMAMYPKTDFNKFVQGLTDNGLLLSLGTWASTPVCLGLVLLFVKLRRGWTVRDYLALKPVPVRTMLGWLGLSLVFVAVSDGLSSLLGRPVVSDFMSNAWRTAGCLPLLWATLLIAAPLFEETFFRGFMVPGILQSRLGATGTVLITATGWALMHVQYDIYAVVNIFLGGILFAVARLKTGSLYPTLAMHSLWNLVAIIEVVLRQSP
jgi:membrane protease YdiL (CAAX protease family)